MSDRIDWIIPSGFDNPGWIIPTVAWSTGVAFQFVSAARDWWSNREARQQQRRSEMSDWTKVIRGEVKRGYRLWLEPRCCPYSRDDCHFYVRELLTNNEDDVASVFMTIHHRMPNNAGRYAILLRQYSIFSSNVYSDIAQVIFQYDPLQSGWMPQKDTQLDDRTVALIFKHRLLARVCVFLIDVKQKSSQRLEIASPPGIHAVMFMCRDENRKNRLRIVYGVQGWNQQEVITVDYELHSSDSDPSRLIACEVANQSIRIPGRRECRRLVFPGTFRLKTRDQTVKSMVLTFDHRGNWRIESNDDWLQNIRASIFGRQWSKAADDFDSLSSALQYQRVLYPLLRGEVLHAIFNGVVFQRHLNVRSMKSLAAEAICRAYPTADLSMLKVETGVDIFDGIYENRKKPMPTIRLIPND